MHEGMQYDPIQGHGEGHEPLIVGNSAIFNDYLLPHLLWGLVNDHGFWNLGAITKAYRAGFFIFVLVFVSRDFEVGSK